MNNSFFVFCFVFLVIWGFLLGYVTLQAKVKDSCGLDGELVIGDYEFNCNLKGE